MAEGGSDAPTSCLNSENAREVLGLVTIYQSPPPPAFVRVRFPVRAVNAGAADVMSQLQIHRCFRRTRCWKRPLPL